MRVIVRSVYSFLVQLHPYSFRMEFGQEMLWIFDERTQSEERGSAQMLLCTHLLLDAVHSAFVQWALREQQRETVDLLFQTACSDSFSRTAEGSVIAFCCLSNLLSIVLLVAALLSTR